MQTKYEKILHKMLEKKWEDFLKKPNSARYKEIKAELDRLAKL